MRYSANILLLAALLLAALWPLSAHAHWPTTVQGYLPIAADSTAAERYPVAVPSIDGNTIIAHTYGGDGDCYQILDRFGNLLFPPDQYLAPALPPNERHGIPKAIPDGFGGAIISWDAFSVAVYAQRLDSDGNRLWGDDGVRAFPLSDHQYDICTDGQGGFWIAIAPSLLGSCGNFTDGTTWSIQNVDGAGNLVLGDSGIVEVTIPQGVRYPRIAPDGAGACYVIWHDFRPPFSAHGAIWAQHLDVQGNKLWRQDLFIGANPLTDDAIRVIPDGEGGIIVQGGVWGWDFNTHYRINAQGEILWTRQQLSWFYWCSMIPGEPGYFYLTFTYPIYAESVYAQRVRIADGQPTWAVGQIGALVYPHPPGWAMGAQGRVFSCFQYPYLYTAYRYEQTGVWSDLLGAQALDADAVRQWSDNGVVVGYESGNLDFNYITQIADEEGGCRLIFQLSPGPSWPFDIYAKRVNADGTLGGPFPLQVTLEPQGMPIQIPPQGGSFTYNMAIADSDTAGGTFDAWIEAVLPSGDTLEIVHRLEIPILPGATLMREGLQQFVPPGAPPGTYSYILHVGNYPYQSSWGQDSFTFQKMASGTSDLDFDQKTAWMLAGWEESPAESPSGVPAMPVAPNLIVSPNPFNLEMSISFALQQQDRVQMTVHDLAGREIARLLDGFCMTGVHTVRWRPDRQASGMYFLRLRTSMGITTQKLLMLK